MLRGSRPGERRGGRKLGTPNRRTILGDRILSIGLDHPAASQGAFLRKLVRDRRLPADTRMAVATPAVVPAIRDWNRQARDALFGVVQDATADPKAQRKAARKIAEFLLPKAAKKAKVLPDEYGFSISPGLASTYRDIQLELRALGNGATQKIPAIAEKIKKLEARCDAIRGRLQMPWPSKYGDNEADADCERLAEFSTLRANKTALTEAQKAEEAHLRARLDVFRASPESIARRRREALEDAEQWFQRSQLFGDFYSRPLSPEEQHDLKFLRRLYPGEAKSNWSELEILDHPFADELQAPNGNFYPRQSKLRWLEQLGNIEQLMPAEDAADQQKPEQLNKSRICDLERRRAHAVALTASEEQDLRDLRERYPEFVAVIDLMDLSYLYQWRREVAIARKAGLDTVAMFEQADLVCLRFRDPSKFTTVSDAEEYRRVHSGKAAKAD